VDESPSIVGAAAEREVACSLSRAGYEVFVPLFASHSRIDLVAALGGAVLRVQCKTARLRNGAVIFRTCSNTGNVPRRYDGEVDVLGVYAPALDEVYLVPIDDLPAGEWCSLRVEPTRSNQRTGIRYAADYEVRRRC
jgi:hypothetical protein